MNGAPGPLKADTKSNPSRKYRVNLATSGLTSFGLMLGKPERSMQRRRAFQLLAGASIAGGRAFTATPLSGQDQPCVDHLAWVIKVLERMQTIRPGMTREALTKVYATEGGISNGLQRTFVSRDCPYFKIDVVFQAVGRPARDGDGRVTLDEDPRDLILNISKPYLQFSIID